MKQKFSSKLWNKAKIALAVGYSLLCCNTTIAQPTLVPSTGATNFWYSSPFLPWSLNTTALAYFLPPPDMGQYGIYASVINENNFPGVSLRRAIDHVYVMDYPSGNRVDMYAPPFDSTLSGTDITIGHSNGTGGFSACNDMILATSFVDTNTNPHVDFYRVTISPLAITYISGFSLPGYYPGTVRIDVICEAGVTAACGGDFAGKFMLTFDDSLSGYVHVAEGDLNTQLLIPGRGPLRVALGFNPDVAGVQRGSLMRDVAYVTYNTSYNSVAMRKWTVGVGFAAAITLDNGSTSSYIMDPRIDAYDAYNLPPSLNNYKVVANALNTNTPFGNLEVRAYDSITYNPGFVTSAPNKFFCAYGIVDTVYHTHTPAVSIWGPDHYAVLHTSEPVTGGPYQEVLVTEPMDGYNSSTYWFNNYYMVNDAFCLTYQAQPADFFCAASTCPNNLGLAQPMLFAWAQYNGMTYDVLYKYSTNFPAFRNADPNAVTEVETDKWTVYPNPATDLLTVKSSLNIIGTDYQVTDVTGRVVLSGQLSHGNTDVNISKLVSGSYFIKLHADKSETQTVRFIKN